MPQGANERCFAWVRVPCNGIGAAARLKPCRKSGGSAELVCLFVCLLACASPRLRKSLRLWTSATGEAQYHSTKLDDGYPPLGLCERRGGDVDASVLSRALRRTVRAQGASSGSTILVFVVQLTRGGAAGTHARSSAALPGAKCCQAYSLKSRVPMERGVEDGGRPPNK